MTQLLQIGKLAPQFQAKDQGGNIVKLEDFSGQWIVLYFYPKDNTPGCTTEASDFTNYAPQFQQLNTTIIGVSPDSVKSHCKFIEKHNLSLQLLSDPDHVIAESYGVWGLKKFMGKEYMGIIRSTFLINSEGKIAHIWTKVRVKNHVINVLNTLKDVLNS